MSRALAPQTARQAKLYRLANKMARTGTPGAPKSEVDKMVWVHSHIRMQDDKALSMEEEKLREKKLPVAVSENSFVTNKQESSGDAYYFRDFPMFPGEYIPPGHDTLKTLRDELNSDLTTQSLREAWMRISGGQFFDSVDDYYRRVDGLDEPQLSEVVAALYPTLSDQEASGLVHRVLESLSHPDNTVRRSMAQSVSAEALGLDNAPGHYTNFLEWMGRLTETKAFKTEHCIDQFCRRKFNRKDVRIMNENLKGMSVETLQSESADSYSHFMAVLKDYAVKVNSTDSRHQIGVRIDPPEIDEVTGCSFGFGKHFYYSAVCVLRENRDKTGQMTVQGKPIQEYFRNEAWHLEHVLMPFDESTLDFRDFDVSFIVEGQRDPEPDLELLGPCCRMAVAHAIAKMVPIARIPLKKAGLLTMDRRQEIGEHPLYLDGKLIRPKFRKR